ncbi:MAG: hypothetical protein M3313_09870 [Actinomycetota bacterium]|nr:hypothetical protein [Actinomycetota bacterium]
MDQGDAEFRDRLTEFVRYRREHLRGDEKGEAQIFSDALFRAFGHAGVRQAGATLEQRIKKKDAKGTAFADLMWKPRCLIEMKKTGVDLGRVYRQAFDYWVQAVPDRPRYVVLCNCPSGPLANQISRHLVAALASASGQARGVRRA